MDDSTGPATPYLPGGSSGPNLAADVIPTSVPASGVRAKTTQQKPRVVGWMLLAYALGLVTAALAFFAFR